MSSTTPRFQWRHRQDDGWGWSSAHATAGPCAGCCPTNALTDCPRCGGRLHRELAIVNDGLGEALFCQQERVDAQARATRTRSAESEAQTSARFAAARRERAAMADRWLGRVIGGVLAVKVALLICFVIVFALGIVTSI
ncbi:hypothetical protein ACIRQH_34915 [Streptomyces sp. NPDC102279]|uniref:hypothetical protein n=1 Tax=Streptomyces sp. NPDC102279 TaxID=3366153 RepID=UPI003807DB48